MRKMIIASQIPQWQSIGFKVGVYLCWNFLCWSATWARWAHGFLPRHDFIWPSLTNPEKSSENAAEMWSGPCGTYSPVKIPALHSRCVCYLNWVLQHHIWMATNHMKSHQQWRSPVRIWALLVLRETTAMLNEDGKSAQGWDSQSQRRMWWKIQCLWFPEVLLTSHDTWLT